MPRPTVHDVARAAGVSLATVDRVLNERPGVRPETIDRVQAAIGRIGFVRDVAAANLARQRSYRFAFVLPENGTALVSSALEEIASLQSHAATDRTQIELVRYPPAELVALVAALDRLGEEQADGIAVLAPETPQTRDAIRRLHARGVRVVTFATDLPGSERDHFVGINNVAAGRTAGLLVGRFLGPEPGRLIVLAGSMQARDHVERRLGFDSVMRESFPHLDVLPSIEGHDDSDLVERVIPRALEAHGNVRGIYAMGGGIRGLVRALNERDQTARPVVIAHELSAETRAALTAGVLDAVIAQDVGHMVRSSVRVLRAQAEQRAPFAAQERIRIDIYTRENLP